VVELRCRQVRPSPPAKSYWSLSPDTRAMNFPTRFPPKLGDRRSASGLSPPRVNATDARRKPYERLAAVQTRIWISLLPLERRGSCAYLDTRDPNSLPLYGIPFAIKDNIDLADWRRPPAAPPSPTHPRIGAW